MSYLALGQPYQPNNFIWYEILLQTTQLCKSYKLVFLLTSETDEGAMAMLGRIYRVFFFLFHGRKNTYGLNTSMFLFSAQMDMYI